MGRRRRPSLRSIPSSARSDIDKCETGQEVRLSLFVALACWSSRCILFAPCQPLQPFRWRFVGVQDAAALEANDEEALRLQLMSPYVEQRHAQFVQSQVIRQQLNLLFVGVSVASIASVASAMSVVSVVSVSFESDYCHWSV